MPTLALLLGIAEQQAWLLAKDELLLKQTASYTATDRHLGDKVIMPADCGPMQTIHWEYLRYRGGEDEQRFSAKRLEPYKLRGIGIVGGLLQWRILLPLFRKQQLVSWTSRAIGDRQPRYWSAPDEDSLVSVRDLLYGIWLHAGSSIIVCEGPLDAIAVGPGAVALMGLRVSTTQLAQLARVPRRFICFDNELMAQRRARKLVDWLSPFAGTTTNVVLAAKDAAAAPVEELEKLRGLLK